MNLGVRAYVRRPSPNTTCSVPKPPASLLPKDQERWRAFFGAYALQVLVEETDRPPVFGDATRPRRCRFCGGVEGALLDGRTVTFKSDAHLIPQQLGNDRLLFAGECDACNQRHGLYESALGEYTKPLRVIMGLAGKKGHPTYKDEAAGLRMQHRDGRLVIELTGDPAALALDRNEGRAQLDTPRDPFRPLHVFKALAKVAYALLDDDELDQYAIYGDLLRSGELDARMAGSPLCGLFGYWFPGGSAADTRPTAALYQRLDDAFPPERPSKVLVLLWANQLWQFGLVSLRDNEGLVAREREAASTGVPLAPFSMPQYPSVMSAEAAARVGPYGTFTDDLSTVELRRRAPFDTTFSFPDGLAHVPAPKGADSVEKEARPPAGSTEP